MNAIALIVRFQGDIDVRPRLLAMQREMEFARGAMKVWTGRRGGLAVQSSHSAADDVSADHGGASNAVGSTIAAVQGVLTEIVADGSSGQKGLDANALLAAFEQLGTECFSRCFGHFGAVIWNRWSDEVVLAVDHVAHRPLFYSATDRELVVASLPHVVALGRAEGCRVDLVELGRRLLPCFPRPAATLFEGVRRVEPGSFVVISSKGVKRRRYWTPETIPVTDAEVSQTDRLEQFRDLVRRAVAGCGQREAGGKLGLLLSGGLDSSALAAAAATHPEIGPARLAATACWPNQVTQRGDDARLGALVAESLQFPIVPVYDGPEPSQALHGWFRGTGSLPGDAFYASRVAMYSLLRGQGAGVVMDGEGGETAATSHTRGWRAELLRTFQFRGLLHDCRAARRVTRASWRELFEDAFKPLVSDHVLNWFGVQRAAGSWSQFIQRAGLHPDYAQFLLRAGVAKDLESAIVSPSFWFPRPHPSVRANDLESLRLLPPDLGLSGLEFGVDVAHPLLDRRLMEWVWAQPSAGRAGAGIERRLVRNAYRGVLPTAVLDRQSKGAFFPGYEQWVMRHFGGGLESEPLMATSTGRELFAPVVPPAAGLDSAVLRAHHHHRQWMTQQFIAWVVGLRARWRPDKADQNTPRFQEDQVSPLSTRTVGEP
ncbi:MAG: asparagine synthase-related protein [Limisphaerales bacterium]